MTDCSTSQSLVLMWRISTFHGDAKAKLDQIEEILSRVPLGSRQGEQRGNQQLGWYDCVIWVGDALKALAEKEVIDVLKRDIGLCSF